jgi:predicted DNA-binding protein with PD1-like motif
MAKEAHAEMAKHVQHFRLDDRNVFAKSAGEFIAFRINSGADLMQNIKSIALNNGVTSGMVLMMLGTLTKARIGFYNTKKAVFEVTEYKEGVELLSGSGSIAMENDLLTPHIHITFADRKNVARGGHLFEGSIVKEYVEGTMLNLTDVFLRRMFIKEFNASPLHFQR